MTKTKKQLRAEAVGRIKNPKRHSIGAQLQAVLGYTDWNHDWDETETALIDLLTDDDEANPDASAFIGYTLKGDTFTGNMGEEADSREKLEADIREWCATFPTWNHAKEFCETVFGWLDRQAAITKRECLDTRVNFAERVGMGNKIDELTDERDHLRRQVDMLNEQVIELTAERERYRERFGKALDLAHEIARLAE